MPRISAPCSNVLKRKQTYQFRQVHVTKDSHYSGAFTVVWILTLVSAERTEDGQDVT